MQETYYRVYTADGVSTGGHKAIRTHIDDADHTHSIGKSLGVSQWRVQVPEEPPYQHASINYVYLEEGIGQGRASIAINGHQQAVAYAVRLLRTFNKNNRFGDAWRRTMRRNPEHEQLLPSTGRED